MTTVQERQMTTGHVAKKIHVMTVGLVALNIVDNWSCYQGDTIGQILSNKICDNDIITYQNKVFISPMDT